MQPAWDGPLSLVAFCVLFALMAYALICERQETAATKRARAVSRAALAVGLFLTLVFVVSGFDWRVLWVVLPVSLVLSLCHANTSYCDKCNATLYNHGWPAPMFSCRRCGAPLQRPVRDGDPLE